MSGVRRTRIAYINHTGQVSGAERVLIQMLRVLDRTRYDAVVLSPADGELAEMVTAEDVNWQPAPLIEARFTLRPDRLVRYAASVWAAIAVLRKKIVEIDAEIVHANSLRAGIVVSLATLGMRRTVVWHVHDTLPSHPVSSMVRLIAYLTPRTQVVAVSHATAEAFAGGFAFGGRMRTIHNGTQLSAYPRKQAGPSAFRESVGVPQDAFLVAAVGQICARKGLLELLQAFKAMHERVPSMHLAIVGRAVFAHEEQYRDALLRYVRTEGIAARVHFTGARRDISAVMQGADLLVLNSHEEPFGLVLVEAMASGTPVLAARVGGIPEIVHDGENGWLTPKGDVAALAAKLQHLPQHPASLARAADLAYRVTCPLFSSERFARDLHRFYAECEARPAYKWTAPDQHVLAKHGDN